MSLKKKIILSFFISSIIIALLVISGYINYIEIKKEISYLELSDTLKSKSLQLRRHEKNFFLYGDIKEIKDVHFYLKDLITILKQGIISYNTGELLDLENKIKEYEQRFNRIRLIAENFRKEFNGLKPLLSQHSDFFPLIESTFLENPLVNAEILKAVFFLKANNPVIKNLQELSTETNNLRKNGEEILTISKALDISARKKVKRYISYLRTAALFLFPLFLFVGLGALLAINIVKRLKILSRAIEETGKGDFSSLAVPAKEDEVCGLIDTLNKMKIQLAIREEELKKKSEELLQSKKLAAIGTLAAGVAHELNNPLNNIYTSAQRLMRKSGDECPPLIKKELDDIFDQTMRVKHIVADLLAFGRGRKPQFREVELNSLLTGVYKGLSDSLNLEKTEFNLNSIPSGVIIKADPAQIEEVFINIFSNAVEAMSGGGALTVDVQDRDDHIIVHVADTGKGIPQDGVEKIFEPFYTTKDKGTGLGLAIVFNIIQKHRGEIRVKSEEGKGTVFIITLPKEE